VDPGVRERVEERYGLDDPIPVQFVDYWKRTLRWDLGESFHNRRSVNDILGERSVNSIRLAVWAILIEIVVGISVGLIAAIRRYSWSDRITTIVTAGASALPVFVLGFILQYGFAVYPNLHDWPDWIRLRTSGLGPDSWSLFFIPRGDQWRYLILPAVALASVSTALAARMARGSMLEVMRADYMRTARAKGLRERQVVLGHGLRNAMLPVVTLIGIDFGTTIGAAILTETVFSWPGLGSAISDSVLQRDLPVTLGLTLVVVIAYSAINLLVDLSYAWFDPRIRLAQRGDA
jgi:ABC-type dipeptide/oligopeptide/nickel transport system permease component